MHIRLKRCLIIVITFTIACNGAISGAFLVKTACNSGSDNEKYSYKSESDAAKLFANEQINEGDIFDINLAVKTTGAYLNICSLLDYLSSPPLEASYVSLYASDVGGDIKISYNSYSEMYSASLIKVPYVLSVLRRVADYDSDALKDDNGNVVYTGCYSALDLSDVFVYYRANSYYFGSGIIQYEADGTEYTYRQLVEYTLKYSDNIAFSELRKRFRYSDYYDYAALLGVISSHQGDYKTLSAYDAGLFLKDLYAFFEENSDYARFMLECMTASDMPDMTAKAASGHLCAHKYGRDFGAFHDMALVYAYRPYVIAVMTDLNDYYGLRGGEDYIYNISKAVNSLMKLDIW